MLEAPPPHTSVVSPNLSHILPPHPPINRHPPPSPLSSSPMPDTVPDEGFASRTVSATEDTLSGDGHLDITGPGPPPPTSTLPPAHAPPLLPPSPSMAMRRGGGGALSFSKDEHPHLNLPNLADRDAMMYRATLGSGWTLLRRLGPAELVWMSRNDWKWRSHAEREIYRQSLPKRGHNRNNIFGAIGGGAKKVAGMLGRLVGAKNIQWESVRQMKKPLRNAADAIRPATYESLTIMRRQRQNGASSSSHSNFSSELETETVGLVGGPRVRYSDDGSEDIHSVVLDRAYDESDDREGGGGGGPRDGREVEVDGEEEEDDVVLLDEDEEKKKDQTNNKDKDKSYPRISLASNNKVAPSPSPSGRWHRAGWQTIEEQRLRRRRPKVLHPDGMFRRTWDFVQLLVLAYICISVPIRVGFDLIAYGGWFIFDLLVDVFFYTDIVLNFFTAFEDENNVLETRRREIAKHYAKFWLILDILASLPIDYIVRGLEGELGCSFTSCPFANEVVVLNDATGTTSPAQASGRLIKLFRVLRVTRLFKLVRLARITKLLEKYQALFFVILPAIGVSRQVFILALVGHLLGCSFYYFGTSLWLEAEQVRREGGGESER